MIEESRSIPAGGEPQRSHVYPDMLPGLSRQISSPERVNDMFQLDVDQIVRRWAGRMLGTTGERADGLGTFAHSHRPMGTMSDESRSNDALPDDAMSQQAYVVDTDQSLLQPQPVLGRLDGERPRTSAAIVGELDHALGVGVDDGSRPVRRNTAEVKPVGEADQVGCEAVPTDMRCLPGPSQVRAG